MVRPCGETDIGICSDENVEDSSGWTAKYRKIETKAE